MPKEQTVNRTANTYKDINISCQCFEASYGISLRAVKLIALTHGW